MSGEAQAQAVVAPTQAPPALTAAPFEVQRSCACGGSSSAAGHCAECDRRRLTVQRYSLDRESPPSLQDTVFGSRSEAPRPSVPGAAYRPGHSTVNFSFGNIRLYATAPTTKVDIGQRDDLYEQEADRVAEQVMASLNTVQSNGTAFQSAGDTVRSTGFSRNPTLSTHSSQRGISNGDISVGPGRVDSGGFRLKPVLRTAFPVRTASPVLRTGSELTPRTTRTPQRKPANYQAANADIEMQAVHVGLIAEDDAAELASGQMRKSEFLDKLQRAVRAAADVELAAVGRNADGCPYIERWIGYYRSRSSSHIERALHRYAPEAEGAGTAREYITAAAERVRRAVSVWAVTGRITGVPDEIVSQASGDFGAADRLLSQPSGSESGPAGASGVDTAGVSEAQEAGINPSSQPEIPSVLSFESQFGHKGGIEAETSASSRPAIHFSLNSDDDPGQIQADLGAGQSLDTSVRSRMEPAFGYDFSRVRIHTDTRAATWTSRLDARAFTIGSDVAFAAGEYEPGSPAGDALLAHELAHVVQQGGGGVSSARPLPKSETEQNSFEEDADLSAASAVATLWSGAKGVLADIAENATPRMKSGLSLQRCGKETCSNGVKTLSVDLVKLHGSNRTRSADLAEANKIYKKCCVQFSVGQEPKPESKDKTEGWLGGDTDLKWHTHCGLEAEEQAMWDGATADHKLSSRMRVFYVATLNPTTARAYSRPPFCATGTAAPYVNHVVVSNDGQSDTLAHEFGHVLLDSGDHHGIDDKTDKDNVMYAPGRTGSEIDASQCKIIYNNA